MKIISPIQFKFQCFLYEKAYLTYLRIKVLLSFLKKFLRIEKMKWNSSSADDSSSERFSRSVDQIVNCSFHPLFAQYKRRADEMIQNLQPEHEHDVQSMLTNLQGT